MHYRLQFTFTFMPLLYLQGGLRDDFADLLAEQGVQPMFPGLRALQRRHQWVIELPRGAFVNDFRADMISEDADLAARQAFFDSLQYKYWHTTRDVFEKDGVWYYRKTFLDRARKLITHNAVFEAAYKFVEAAEADRSIIKGTKPRRPRVSPEERIARFGKMVRGPGWSAEEDAVLRRWFSIRTYGDDAGKHARLTEEQWGYVLEGLNGLRTKSAVTQRIWYLNDQLKKRFVHEGKIVDGYISTTALAEYKRLALGEHPRMPPQRPTIGRRNDASAPRDVDKTLEERWTQAFGG